MKAMRPTLEIILSTATETGMSIAVERLGGVVDGFFFVPHDFPWTVDRLIKRIRPSLFVLIETDFCANLVRGLNKESVPAVLVNARLSPGSYRSYSRLGVLADIIFGGFDLILTQTETDRERFVSLRGIGKKVTAAGNLKYDSPAARVSESEVASIRAEIGLAADRRIWVAGSTHEGEEQILLRIHRDLVSQVPDLLLLIAPRKIHRGCEIAALAAHLGFDFGIRSKGENTEGKAVYILDTLGELARVYAICDIAFLGGSFAPIGSHNPLEAVAQGRPACWGPHFYNFGEIERDLLAAGCAVRVSSENELNDFLQNAFNAPGTLSKIAQSANNFAGLQRNAANGIASVVLEKVR
jgi:3-deoxy-D-manno-octulosonic-acid transferase